MKKPVFSSGIGILVFCLLVSMTAHAWQWADLWQTRDQQALKMMQSGQYQQAESTFSNPAWAASAAFKAQDYQRAQAIYATLPNQTAYYNLGNTLAHLGQYQQAIAAYDKALASKPDDEDARFNRQLLMDFLQQQAQKQSAQKPQDKQAPANTPPQKGQSQADQANTAAKQSPTEAETKQQGAQQHPQAQPTTAKHPPAEPSPPAVPSTHAPTEPAQSQPADAPAEQPAASSSTDASSSASQREAREAQSQWLRLIPDEPGGLLREKFRRDYLHMQGG